MSWENAAKITRALLLLAAGAYLTICYLHFKLVPKVAEVEVLYHQVFWWWTLVFADGYCRSKCEPVPALANTGPDYTALVSCS